MQLSSFIDWSVPCGSATYGKLELLFLSISKEEYAIVPAGKTVASFYPIIIDKASPVRLAGNWRTIKNCMDAVGVTDIRELVAIIEMGLVAISGCKKAGQTECIDQIFTRMVPFEVGVKSIDAVGSEDICDPCLLEEYGVPHWIIQAMQYNNLVLTMVDNLSLVNSLLPYPLEAYGTWDKLSKQLMLAHGMEGTLIKILECENLGVRRKVVKKGAK